MLKNKILIVEDEAIVAKDIAKSLIRKGYEVVATFSKAEKAIDFLKENTVDLVLMDIMLAGNLNGVEAASIVKGEFSLPVIFLTAYADEKTISKAKVTEPYGYVIKPFKEVDLLTSIEMALYKFRKDKDKAVMPKNDPDDSSKEFLFVKSNSKLVKVENKNILFVEALKDYVMVHTKNEKYIIHSTMKEIERKFPKNSFIRVHRSFIINLKKIDQIDSSLVQLENYSKQIPIGGSYKSELFNRLNLA